MIEFEELDLKKASEEVREELDPLYNKHAYLHEMIREFYAKNDLESETVKYLDKKLDELNARLDTLHTVQKYLANLAVGAPFYVNRRVGLYMARFELSEDKAQLLVDVYREHKKSMGTKDQNKYKLAAVRKVEWDEEENCLHVHFKDTWFHYCSDRTWY